jgi:DNA-directed RNA polymerase sigma subunit (sigma70/sigma32)
MGCEQERVVLLLQMQQETLSLEQPASFDDDNEDRLGDVLEAPDEAMLREQQAIVADLLKHLTMQERQVIEVRYQLGAEAEYSVEDVPLPYAEVSRRLKMTTDLTNSVESRALMKLRFWAQQGIVFSPL